METNQPKSFVFVLMPFSEDFNDIYQLGIKQACVDAGVYCERVDEQTFPESMLERIYNQISKADLVIADMTGKNPNVFYEVGYAHALGKRVVLLTQDASDIPFDLKHYKHIVYDRQFIAGSLKGELQRSVQWYIENPSPDEKSTADFSLQLFIGGVCLTEEGVEVRCECLYEPRGNLPNVPQILFADPLVLLGIDMRNLNTKTFTGDLNIGLVTSSDYMPYSDDSSLKGNRVILPDGKYMHFFQKNIRIFPDCWESVTFILKFQDSISEQGLPNCPEDHVEDMSVRVFTELGIKEFPLKVRPPKRPERKEQPYRNVSA